MNALDSLANELEAEIKRDPTYMSTMLDNASKPTNHQPTPKPNNVISTGPFKGVNKSEAIAKVMKKNETLPNAIRGRESDEAREKLGQFTARLAQLEAEHEVRVESIASVYDQKINNNQMLMKDLLNQIKELNEQIKVIDDRVGELANMNYKIMDDKQAHILNEETRTNEQRNNLNQIISSIKSYIENLAIAIN